jgi:hypothetical protein
MTPSRGYASKRMEQIPMECFMRRAYGVHWSGMITLLQKLLATLAAVSVLVTCFRCPCQGAETPNVFAGVRDSGIGAPVCQSCCHTETADRPALPGKQDRSGRGCPTCNRCRGSAISEASACAIHPIKCSPAHRTLESVHFKPINGMAVSFNRFALDLPPPLEPSTLLSLRCALIL